MVLYCGGGFRSAIAAESLTRMGYSDVYSLWGGWRSLVAAGLASPNQ
ncbi:MAG: rhodanese-like domain-containing protein [Candidatus Thermoplasmatota archaeon]|nr:rhodanese-like domain-containing protein [Candidatus Thermoplasmatota archaeon]